MQEEAKQETLLSDEQVIEYPLEPIAENHVRTIEIDETSEQYVKGAHNWYFIYTEQENMLGSDLLDKTQKHLGI